MSIARQITLEQAHLRTRTAVPLVGRATEDAMWSYAVQVSTCPSASAQLGIESPAVSAGGVCPSLPRSGSLARDDHGTAYLVPRGRRRLGMADWAGRAVL